MICEQCGSENALDALFCMRCGAGLAVHSEATTGGAAGTRVVSGQPGAEAPGAPVASGHVIDPASGLWVQAVTIPGGLPYAEWWRRLVVSILDGLIIAFWYMVVMVVAALLTWVVDPSGTEAFFDSWVATSTDRDYSGDPDELMSSLNWPSPAGIATFVACMLVGAVVSALYQILMTASERFQGTFGKVIVQAKVCDDQGNRITRVRATGRYFSKWLYNLSYPGTLLTVVSAITIAAHGRKQALHDMIAGTVVLRRDIVPYMPAPVAAGSTSSNVGLGTDRGAQDQ